MDTIHAFSIALGQADAGLTERELQIRKNEARVMALAFMPSMHTLLSSQIEERLVADGGNLWLAFDLVPMRQMHLALDSTRFTGNVSTDITRQLLCEFSRLREEAGEFVIRIGRLAGLANKMPQLDSEERLATIESMPDEDRTTWEIMHRRAGRHLSVRFGDETLDAQLPLLNLYVAEPTNRSISATVSSICAKSYQLNSIRSFTTDIRHVALPSSMKMDRPRQVIDSVRQSRFLLHVAEEAGVRVMLQVRAVLWQSDLSPAYLEFHGIDDSIPLREALQRLSANSATQMMVQEVT